MLQFYVLTMFYLATAASAVIMPTNNTTFANLDKSFHWEMCDSSGAIQVQQLTVKPDPLVLPGDISISGKFSNSMQVVTPVVVKIEMFKHVAVWIKVPCINNLGSCTFDDVCKHVPQDAPFKCPLAIGPHTIENYSISLAPSGMPPWLEAGNFKMELNFEHDGQTLGCVRVFMNIKAHAV